MTSAAGSSQGRSPVQLLLGLAGLLIILALALTLFPNDDSAERLAPTSTKPNGGKAVVDLLRELDNDVNITQTVPNGAEAETVVVLQRDISADQLTELEGWVERGGRAVVVDTFAPLAPRAGAGLAVTDGIEVGECDIDSLAELEPLVLDSDDGFFVEAPAFERGVGDFSCFGAELDAFVVVSPLGEGVVVSVASGDIFTNRLVDEGDNAVLAASLMAPRLRTPVVVLEPDRDAPAADLGGQGGETAFGLVPARWTRMIIIMGLAGLLYLVQRGRRLGKPVTEKLPVVIEGSELVAAVGNLLLRTKDPNRSAQILRADLRESMRSRLGLSADISETELVHIGSRRLGLSEAQVGAAVTARPVSNEADLITLTHHIEIVQTRLSGAPTDRVSVSQEQP